MMLVDTTMCFWIGLENATGITLYMIILSDAFYGPDLVKKIYTCINMQTID